MGKYSTHHDDVWALGIILMNIITAGRNPWRYATADDKCFAVYLHDNNFFRRVLPILDSVITVLKWIFTINPMHHQLPEGDGPDDMGQLIICESASVLSVPSTASSGLSGTESEGPITYPVKPAINVLDIPEEEGLGQLADLPTGAFTGKFKAPVRAKPKKSKGHLFYTAMRHIKDRHTASMS